jgi:hypothetical protein
METLTPELSAAELLVRFQELEPRPVANFVPANRAEEKRAVLADEKRCPEHDYALLNAIDFEAVETEIEELGQQILADPSLNLKYRTAYAEFVEGYKKKTELIRLARAFKSEQDVAAKSRIKEQYMALNIELYGEPDETTYRSLLNEKMSRIMSKKLTGKAATYRDELVSMTGYTPGEPVPERFKPSDETVAWMHGVAEDLYGGLLAHVPEQATFTREEVAETFRTIIREGFGESASDWSVELGDATSIDVQASEKRIIIPSKLPPMSQKLMRGMVVHEIGVHMLRAIQGYESDLPMLATGLSDYYDSEEGLGLVMMQALEGKYEERGVEHYITAGAAYYDGKDFRDLYEMNWRLALLENADGEDVTDEATSKAKNGAYTKVMRSLRGTDELPWFKDLAYFNGAVSQWKYLESIVGDDLKFMFVLLGKADSSNIDHERTVYETRTVGSIDEFEFDLNAIAREELRSAVLADGGFTGLYRALRNSATYSATMERYFTLLEAAASAQDRIRRLADPDNNLEQTEITINREVAVAANLNSDRRTPDAHAALLATTIFTTAFPNFLPPRTAN